MKEKKAFLAEIGDPDIPRSIIGGSANDVVIVLAENYKNAVSVIETYVENIDNNEKSDIFDDDGSLRNDLHEKTKIQLLSLKVTDVKVIW